MVKFGIRQSSAFQPSTRVRLRPVLALVGRQQVLTIERLDSHEHLETTRSGQQLHQRFLSGDLGVTLHEEIQV